MLNNHLSLRLELHYDEDDELDQNLLVNIYVDGKFLQDWLAENHHGEDPELYIFTGLYPDELYESLTSSDDSYREAMEATPIFSCYSCHIIDCMALGARISSTEEYIRWEKFVIGWFPNQFKLNTPALHFSKENYEQEVSKLKLWANREAKPLKGTYLKVYDGAGDLIPSDQLSQWQSDLLDDLETIAGQCRDYEPGANYRNALVAGTYLHALLLRSNLDSEYTVVHGPVRILEPIHIQLLVNDHGHYFAGTGSWHSHYGAHHFTALFRDMIFFVGETVTDVYQDIYKWISPIVLDEVIDQRAFNAMGEKLAIRITELAKGQVVVSYRAPIIL